MDSKESTSGGDERVRYPTSDRRNIGGDQPKLVGIPDAQWISVSELPGEKVNSRDGHVVRGAIRAWLDASGRGAHVGKGVEQLRGAREAIIRVLGHQFREQWLERRVLVGKLRDRCVQVLED